MYKSKLIRSLHILNAEEMKRLQSFLRSPYFNTNSNIVKLYRVLSPHHPEFKSPRLAREKVFEKIFPGRKYAHQQMLNLMSEFNGLIQQYLVIRTLEREDVMQEKLLLQAYAERPNCYAIFEKRYQLLDRKLEEMPYRDELYFQEKKNLNLLYYGHPDTRLQKGDKGSLKAAIEYFEAYRELTSLKLQCAKNARRNTVKGKQEVGTRTIVEDALMKLYRRLEVFQRSPKAESFDPLLNTFESNISLLRIDDRRNVLNILLNYCIRQTNSGDSEFFRVVLDLFKLGIAYDCLLVQGRLKNTTFHNIVTVGVTCLEFDWTKSFMDEYQEYLDAKEKADTVAMGQGVWHFEKGEHEEVIALMQHVFREPKDVFKSKALLVRSWFELWLGNDNYFELLSAQLEAFEKFTRRDYTLTPKLKEAFLKFITFTKKLANSWWDKDGVQKLSDEIEQEPNLVFKKWLLEKSAQ